MHKIHRQFSALAIALIVASLTLLAMPALADDADRDARILANLKLQFPQLEEASVSLGAIEPSGFEGLEKGSFTFNTPRGPQGQNFFISSAGTLYLIAGEVDVSKSKEEIDAVVAERQAAEAKKAAELAAQLKEAIVDRPILGNPDAPVTIVEFSDFQCPFCARGANTIEEVMEKYGDDVKVVFKHFPLDFHKWAKPAAIAAFCAGEQNDEAFWTLHDKYFENQKALTAENVLDKSKEYLAGAELDMSQWETCATDTDSAEYKEASATVDADMAFGQQLGVTGTPGFFVNGRLLSGAQPLSAFEPIIEEAKNDA